MTVLELSGVTKRFGGLVASNNVTFDLKQGEVLALIGPNGAGKTTLINLITGRLIPDSGDIHLMGQDIRRLSPQRRVGRGLVRTFQITTLFAEFTVWENIALAAAERLGLGMRTWPGCGFSRSVIVEAEAIAEQVRLSGVGMRVARELSYGQQRVLEIAIALALRPKVLLLDEPAAGLPSSDHGLITDVIRNLPDGVGVLLIEHDMDLVFSLADRITVLAEGTVLMSGAPQVVAQDRRVKSVYLGGVDD